MKTKAIKALSSSISPPKMAVNETNLKKSKKSFINATIMISYV